MILQTLYFSFHGIAQYAASADQQAIKFLHNFHKKLTFRTPIQQIVNFATLVLFLIIAKEDSVFTMSHTTVNLDSSFKATVPSFIVFEKSSGYPRL